jgi:hypothetical protein
VSTGHEAPLAGLAIRVEGRRQPESVAAWLLSAMGARIAATSRLDGPFAAATDPRAEAEVVIGDEITAAVGLPRASLRRSAITEPDPGVPPGTWAYASGAALAVAALGAWRCGCSIEVSELGVAIQVHLPDVMAAAYSAPHPPLPPSPREVPGGGFVQADLGAPGDDDEFALLMSILGPDADASAVAAAAQEWRLPVCDYRKRPDVRGVRAAPPLTSHTYSPGATADPRRPLAPRPEEPLSGTFICDMTTMWAGPLCTWLCQSLGASVVKIEPRFRLDGTRAAARGGIYPGGVQREAGSDSGLWNALNRGKRHAPLDLRSPDDRSEFLDTARRSAVVVESFSPRVMANFGIEEDLSRGSRPPTILSLPAFPPGPMRDWVAYGTGVHAVAGLGDVGDGRFAAPAVAYPDPVAGMIGAFAVLCASVGRDRGRPLHRVEAPLYSACAPLLRLGRPGRPWGAPHTRAVGRRLLEAGRGAGEFELHSVAGTALEHPRGPFTVRP